MKKALFILCILLNGHMMMGQATVQFNILLKKEVFTNNFFLLLREDAKENLDVFDALKISDGYVSIASVPVGQPRLSIDARPFPAQQQSVDLFVKGYKAGNYTLIIDPGQGSSRDIELNLIDRLLQKEIQIGDEKFSYEFHLDSLKPNETAMNRFALVFNKAAPAQPPKPPDADLLAFPNPFVEKISLNVKNNEAAEAVIRILDIQGKVCMQLQFKDVLKDQILEIPCGGLLPGIYLLEWKTSKKVKTLKIIKI